MRRTFLAICVAVLLGLGSAWPQLTQAQDDGSDNDSADTFNVELFGWAEAEGGFTDNWDTGLALALVGILGAAIAVFLVLGEPLPSAGSKAEYDLLGEELEEYQQALARTFALREMALTGPGPVVPPERLAQIDALTDDLSRQVENVRRARQQLRRMLIGLGVPLYLVIGAAIASAVADDLVQALVVGFGWTAVADRFGLRNELAVKKTQRSALAQAFDEQRAAQAARATEAEAEANELRAQIATKDAMIATLTREIESSMKDNPDG